MNTDFEIGIVFPDQVAMSQLEIWLPYLINSSYKVCIFAQTCSPKIIYKIPFPVFSIDSGFSIYDVKKFTKLEFLLYPTNRSKNFNWLLKFPHLKHIFIGHGDSEKHSSSSRIINAYDFVMLSNFDSYKRYRHAGVRLGLEKCLFMGVPTQEGITYKNTPCNNVKSILYAPTFEGNSPEVNYSSLEKIHNIVFKNKYNIIFRPHPGTGKRDKNYKNILLKYEKSTLSKVQQFNKSDIIICDISGIKNEYLFTGKPIVIPASNGDIKNDILHSLSSYCYIWDYKNVLLYDFILSIKDDEKYKNRIRYRNKKYLGCLSFNDSLYLFLKQLEFTRKYYKLRKFYNIISGITMEFGHHSLHSMNTKHIAKGHTMNKIVPQVPVCPVCGSTCSEKQIIKTENQESVSGLCHLFECDNCHFVNFPSNTTKNLNPISDRSGVRAGSIDKPGREYFIFEAIKKYIFYDKKISVCIYGSGLSCDHHHIRKHDMVSECKITDLQNYQQSDFFIDNPGKKFDLVIASEVIEHFENPEKNFNHLLSFVSDSGLLFIGTNIHVPNSKLDNLKYPFFLGHCSYWSPESLDLLVSRYDYKLFFMNTSFGGPKKRAIFIFKDENILKNIVLLTGKKQFFI